MDHLEAQIDALCEQAATKQIDNKAFLTQALVTLFFRMIVRWYERASTIVTSNKSFLDWGEVFNDPVLVTAVLDRLLHYSTTVRELPAQRETQSRVAGKVGVAR